MRLGLIASAATLTMVAAPANAAVYVVGIGGTLSGTTTTVLCTSGPSCLPPNNQRVDPFGGSFNVAVGTLNLAEGDNNFTFGSPYVAEGYFTGIINNAAGVLTGRQLSYSRQTCSPGIPTNGCQLISGTAATFAVSGGVPEPATWALMLLGFGAVGTAMRRRRTVAAPLSFAA